MPHRPTHALLAQIPLAVCAALLLAAGCARHSTVAPGTSPSHVRPRIHWLRTQEPTPAQSVDSMNAEALDASGAVIAGPAGLIVDSDGGTYTGSLDVPAGAGRSIRVNAFERGDLLYRGVSSPLLIHGGDTLAADVLVRPALSVALVPSQASAQFGDSVDIVVVDTAGAPFSHLITLFHSVGSSVRIVRALRGPDLPADASFQGNLGGIRADYSVDILAGNTPLPAGTKRLAIFRAVVCSNADCGDGEVTQFLADTTIASGLHQTTLPALNYGTQVTARKPASTGGGTPRYAVHVYIIRSSSDSGAVYATVSDESLFVDDTTAVITLTPENGSPVQLKAIADAYYATGDPSLAPDFPLIPIDFGRRYTVTVDRDGNGTSDASATVRAVPRVTVTNPAEGGRVSPTFTMTWEGTTPADSTRYYAAVENDSTGVDEIRYGAGSTSVQFDTLRDGTYTATLVFWNGPFASGPVPGFPATPNLIGSNMSGFFWTYYTPESIQFSVGSFQSAREAVPGGARLLPPWVLDVERRVRALSHKR